MLQTKVSELPRIFCGDILLKDAFVYQLLLHLGNCKLDVVETSISLVVTAFFSFGVEQSEWTRV